MALTFREHIDVAVTQRDDLLDNCEAKADALMIHLCRAKQLTEAREQLSLVLLSYAYACVSDVSN